MKKTYRSEVPSDDTKSHDTKSDPRESSSRYPGEYLRRLRNEISLLNVLRALHWPHKQQEGRLRFQCPRCEFGHTSINPRTNLGRCFRCAENFNPIDFVMAAENYDFLMAVTYLSPLLPPESPEPR
jgi:hypothetical protein